MNPNKDAEVKVATSSSHHQQQNQETSGEPSNQGLLLDEPSNQGLLLDEPSNQGISDEDFREILSSMSEWYDRHGYINMLKVLLRDLVTEPDKLYTATKVIELFELVCTSGHLSSADLTVLYDTINVTQSFGLEPVIRKLTTLLNIRTVSISKFTHNRQMLISVIKSLDDNSVKMVSQLYNCPQKVDRWELFVDLEQRSEFCEENLDDFMRKITMHQIDSRKRLRATGDMDVATGGASPSTSTDNENQPPKCKNQKLDERSGQDAEVEVATSSSHHQQQNQVDDQGELIVIGDTYVATSEAGQSTSSDVCMVNNTVVQGNRGSVTGSQFSQCNIGKVIVNSTTAVSSAQGNQNDAESSNPWHQEQHRDRVIKNYLTAWQKKIYQDVNRMTPATWNKQYEIDIAQVFTDLELRKSKREDCGEREAKPSTLAEVLNVIKSTDSCKVLITGKGGMGKTTLLRHIAHNWVTDGDNTFAGKLLFLIKIRDIKVGKNVMHAIMQQIKLQDFNLETDLPDDPKIIKKFIMKHNDEIVLLLDGLDELEQGAESPISLFKRHELVKSTVILTSRPENTTGFDKSCDVHVTVKGFSPSSIKQYIHKHFKLIRRPELGESLTREFMLDSDSDSDYSCDFGGKHKEAIELCSSPFLLLRICTMWKDKQYLPKDVSELFKELTCCILNQYINKSDKGKAISHFYNIPKNYESAILALGKCMYEGLQINKLSIDKVILRGECKDEETVDLAIKVGFVYRDEPASEYDFKEIYTPPHKLISESLAGLYLCKQSQQGSLKSDECEMIRSNENLHMTRVFAVGFLGADAGKLLKHWLINRASNYYSLAQCFRYVKEEHEKHVLKELDEHMPTEMKVHCERMCDSFKNVLCIDGSCDKREVSKDVHLIQLMSVCCVKYEGKPVSLEDNMLAMIKKSTELLSMKDVCAMIVDILIIVEGLYDALFPIKRSVIEYLVNWDDKEIDILSAAMKNVQFKYTFKQFNFEKFEKLSPKFLIHFLTFACDLTRLWIVSSVTGVVFDQVVMELHESQVSLKLEIICLISNNLHDVNGVSLANLHIIAPKLKNLEMNNCQLSGTIINAMITECQSNMKDNMLSLKFNDLSDIDGVTLAKLVRLLKDDNIYNWDNYGSSHIYSMKWSDYSLSADNLQSLINAWDVDGRLTWTKFHLSGINLASINGKELAQLFKICPELMYLDMSNCNLSGSSMRNVLNECDRIGVVLKDNMLRLKGNDLSDIDGVSLAKLVRIIVVDYDDEPNDDNYNCFVRKRYDYDGPHFYSMIWSDYSLSADNLQGLINACGVDGRLTWTKLYLSGINLASVNGKELAHLFKICPELMYLDMSNCNMSGSSMRNVLNECDRIGVVLKGNMLSFKGNDLSDIDGASLAKLVRLIRCPFKWSDYSFSADNLQGLINSCGVDGRLTWTMLDLSGINLASINGKELAHLFQICPGLRNLDMSNCNLSGSSMRNVLNECDRIGVGLKGNMLRLNGNDLSDIDGVSLAKLVRILVFKQYSLFQPTTYLIKWSDYSLSADNLQGLISACGVDGRLTWTRFDLSGINLASINGKELAHLFKICPELIYLDISYCNLSGSSMRNLLNECDRIGVVLKYNMLRLKGNDLSDIDGVSLAKLVRVIVVDYDDYNRFARKWYDDDDNYGFALKCYDCGCSHTCIYSMIWRDHSLSADNLQGLINACGVDGRLTWTKLDLSGINLASINGKEFAHLFKICPGLRNLDMSNCNLSGSIMRNALNECDRIGVVLKDNMLRLKGNGLSDIDGASLAKLVRFICCPFKWSDYSLSADNLQGLINAWDVDGRLTWTMLDLSGINLASINGKELAHLFKISPELRNIDMSNCNLSGSSLRNVLNECDRIGVVLKGNIMLRLKGNDLSDIDGVLLDKLERLICCIFKWSDYSLSADNLQGLINACGDDGRLTWTMLDLSGINLASINGKELAHLFKICPGLINLDMSNCNLSGSSMRNVLNECDSIGVVLKDHMLSLNGNDLSDIDGVSLAKLVRILVFKWYIRVEPHTYLIKWSDYFLSADNLQGLINACGFDGRLIRTLDLSGINLASINPTTLVRLFKIFPHMNHLDMSNCNLSGSSMRNVLNECDSIGVVLKDNIMLILKGNDLSDIDGVSLAKLVRIFSSKRYDYGWPLTYSIKWSDYCLSADNLQCLIDACGVDGRLTWTMLDLSGINLASINATTLACLFKISPHLNHLDMSHCNLSGRSMRNVLHECNRIGVVLKGNMLSLKGNDLSDIDGLSFAKLVRLNRYCFKWSDYCCSTDNLKVLVSSVSRATICIVDGTIYIDIDKVP